MALISCPECNKEISDKAASCPGCGVPIANTPAQKILSNQNPTVNRGGAKWEGIGFLMIAGGMIYGMASAPGNHIGGAIAGIGFLLFLVGRFK